MDPEKVDKHGDDREDFTKRKNKQFYFEICMNRIDPVTVTCEHCPQ